MRYGHAKNLIRAAIPGATGRVMEMEIEKAFRHRQLEASLMNPKGWAWQPRTVWSHNAGGYDEGAIEATQDGRDLLLTGGSFPDPCTGWMIAIVGAEEEGYRIESRTAASAIKIDRPYEGESGGGKDFKMYDPYCSAPADLYAWAALTLQAEDRVLIHDQVGHVRGRWPKQTALAGGYLECIGPPTDAAGYATGTVTVAKGSAAVTGSGTTFPEWIAQHHLRVGNEGTLYRIKQWVSDTALTLDRAYGGANGGAGLVYAIDPPGAMQFEVHYPAADQFAMKIDYWCEPEQLINETDPVEGTEAYARALIDLATADVLMTLVAPDEMTEGMGQQLMATIKMHASRGQEMLAAMIQSNAPVPEEDAALVDVRYDMGVRPWTWLED